MLFGASFSERGNPEALHETGGDKARAGRHQGGSRELIARELAALRGVRDSCEGKPLKGQSLDMAAARNKAANFESAETAEGLRKPESGSGRRASDSPPLGGDPRG